MKFKHSLSNILLMAMSFLISEINLDLEHNPENIVPY